MEASIERIGTIVTLAIVAFIEAANEAIKDSLMLPHLPAFLKSGLWNFAPLTLLIILGIAWLMRILFVKGPLVSSTQIPPRADVSITQEPTVDIADAPDLIRYRNSVEHSWNDVKQSFNNFIGAYEDVLHFWEKLEKAKHDLQFQRMFPGDSLTEKDVAPTRTQFQNDGEKLRSSLKDLSTLLNFRFRS